MARRRRGGAGSRLAGMFRSRGGSSKSSEGSSKSWFSTDSKPNAKPVANTPKPSPAAPPPPSPAPVVQPASGSDGIGSIFTEGMAFGAGSSIGRRAADAVVGPRVFRHETKVSPPLACSNQANSFQDCLSNYETEISRCQMYMDLLCECRRSVGSTATGLNA